MKILLLLIYLTQVVSAATSSTSRPSPVSTGLGDSYVSGQTFASSKLTGVQDASRYPDKTKVPGYTTDEPLASKQDAATLGKDSYLESIMNDGSYFVRDSSRKRQTFTIDAKADPLVIAGNKATEAPLKTINEKIEVVNRLEEQKDYYEFCDEGKDEALRTCSKTLQIHVTVHPEVTRLEQSCPGHKKKAWRSGTRFCEPRACQSRTIVDRHRQVVISDIWSDGCTALEAAVDEGLCSYDSVRYSTRGETRSIGGEAITRDHFEEHYTYRCFKKTDDKCERLRAQGCVQVASECKEKEGSTCLVWTQTYRCRPNPILWQSYKSTGEIFCLGGDCHRVAYGPNGEFLDAIAHLSIFKEAQADLRASIGIFGGNDRRCTRNCLNFRDCCGNGKGWGVSLHLSECSKQELELGELRNAKKCVHIGTFCAEKALGVCIRKQTSFCCFGTKLSRIIQEQARVQLGMGWGTPERPECKGLDEYQLSQLDFSKMDLSELYSDIQATMKSKTKEDVAPIAERLQTNVSNMSQKITQDKAVAERKPM
jgi:hypothetical protein